MARAVLEIIASATDRASQVFNRISATGEVAARRISNSWERVTSPITRVMGTIRRLETVVFAFLASRAIRGLDRFLDKFGGSQYDAARQRFIVSMGALGQKLGNVLGPKFAGVLDSLSEWVDKNQEKIVAAFGRIADAMISAAKAIVESVGALGGVIEWINKLPYRMHPIGAAARAQASGESQTQAPTTQPNPWARVDFEGWRRSFRPPPGPWAGVDFRSWQRTAAVGQTARVGSLELTWIDKLRQHWAQASDTLSEKAVRAALTIENNLSTALTDMILDIRNAGEYFREFGKSVIRTVLQMFVETGVRRVFSAIASGFGGSSGGGQNYFGIDVGGGGNALGAGGGMFGGGGGGSVTINHNYITAVDTKSFAQALAESERETGMVTKIASNAAARSPGYRAAHGIR